MYDDFFFWAKNISYQNLSQATVKISDFKRT